MLFAFRSLLQIQDLPRHDLLSQDLGDSLYGAPDTSPQATSLDWSDLSLLLIFLQYPGKLDNKQSLVFCNLIITGNCRPVRKLVCYIYPSRESFLFIKFNDSFYNNLTLKVQNKILENTAHIYCFQYWLCGFFNIYWIPILVDFILELIHENEYSLKFNNHNDIVLTESVVMNLRTGIFLKLWFSLNPRKLMPSNIHETLTTA